jgi:hypothetical protein
MWIFVSMEMVLAMAGALTNIKILFFFNKQDFSHKTTRFIVKKQANNSALKLKKVA